MLSRWPAPQRCKRRLAMGVGVERAAAIQARLLLHGLVVARQALDRSPGPAPELVLAVEGLGRRAAARWGRNLGRVRTVPQGRGGLGVRLQRQVRRARREGAGPVVLIGSDLPELAALDLLRAFTLLESHPLVLGPARDGGYWLIGLAGDWPALFAGLDRPIPWGGAQVLARTLAVAEALGLEAGMLPLRADLDRPVDLERWR